jgi:hypothetical protein
MAAPLATDRPLGRAPITAGRRPRTSTWQSHAFGPASLPGGAGIPADRTPGHEENR